MNAPAAGLRVAVAAESLTRWFDARATFEHVRALGCREVQLCSSLFAGRMNFSQTEAEAMAALLAEHGLRGESLSTFPAQTSPERYATFLRRVTQYAPILGVRVVNTYLFPFAAPGRESDDAVANYARALEPVLRKAADHGIVFCLEPESFDVSRDVAGLKRILAAVDHPNFRITFDACNLYQGGEEAFPYAYEELRGAIGHVHLKNGSVHVEDRHPADEKAFAFAGQHAGRVMRWGPIREGAINLAGLLARLVRDGYDGAVVVEPHTQSAQKQLDFLRDEVAFVRSAAG